MTKATDKIPFPSEEERKHLAYDFIRSARRSTYTMSAGAPSSYYFDVDEFFLGRGDDESFLTPEELSQRRERVVGCLSADLIQLASRHAISRLAFVDKMGVGPVGMVAWMSLLASSTGLDVCIVRPRKRVAAASLKGHPAKASERFLVVTDVATTGRTIASAVRRLRELGGEVPVAYAFYDRCEGAKKSLAQDGVELASHLDRDQEKHLEAELLHT